MIKVLVFDFDGIILESSEIKTIAFKKMFEYETEDVQKIMYEYHLSNMGFSRQKKFTYYFEEIKKQSIPDGKIDKMSEHFRSLVLDEVLKAEFVPGMPEFLETMHEKYPLYIATGTPNDEIATITKARGVSKYFKGIYGTPDTKEDIINSVITLNGYDHKEVVFFGDAESDRISALRTGVHFIGRTAHGSEMMGDTQYKIDNFTDIVEIEKIIGKLELGA